MSDAQVIWTLLFAIVVTVGLLIVYYIDGGKK